MFEQTYNVNVIFCDENIQGGSASKLKTTTCIILILISSSMIRYYYTTVYFFKFQGAVDKKCQLGNCSQ